MQLLQCKEKDPFVISNRCDREQRTERGVGLSRLRGAGGGVAQRCVLGSTLASAQDGE